VKTPHRNHQNPGCFQTGGIVALSVAHFVHDVYSGFLAPLLPLLIEKLSISLTQAGLLSTVMQLPHLANPWVGMIADRVSVRYFVILAPTLTAIPMSLIGVAPSYGVLLILLFVAGISVALFHVPAPVMVARLAGPHKGRGMSFFMTGGELARALSPLVAVGAVSLLGMEGFYPVMVVGIATSVWLFFRFKDVPIGNPGKAPIALSRTWRGMKRILGPVAAILTMRGFMHAALTSFLPTFIQLETGNLWLAGIALTVSETAGVAGVLLAGPLSDRFGRRRILLVSLVGAPIALALLTWTTGWIRFVMMVATGLTLLSTTPVMLAMIQEHAIESPSSANGLFMMVSFMARSATVVIIGWIGDVAGLKATYTVAAALGLLAIPFALKLPRGNGSQEE
jgi:FSR family fosmidomycin resistance protein-like MFS transporter